MTTTFKAQAEKMACVGAARRMIIGILGREYEQTLVIHSQDATRILYKKVHANKQGWLGRRRPEQKEALTKALAQLVKEGIVSQTKLSDGKMALTLEGNFKKSNVTRLQPKRRTAFATRKRSA